MADGTGAAPAAGDGSASTGAEGAGQAGSASAAGGAAQNGAGSGAGAGTTAVTTPPPAQAAWHGELSAEDIGWLQNKAWFGTDIAKADVAKSFPAFVKAARQTESFVGRNKVALPKDVNDTEGWNQFYTAGGRPANWQAYGLKAPENGDQSVLDSFSEIAFDEGLSTKQATNVAQRWDARVQELAAKAKEAADHQFNTQSAADVDAIRREWGGQSDAKFAAAQRAGHAFNISKENMTKIERAIGTKDFLTMMANIGASVSEDQGPGNGADSVGGNVMTKEMAAAELKELSKDSAFQQKYLAGDKDAVAQMRKINAAMAG